MKKIIATTNAPAAIGPYSQAIDCGSFLVTSGQVPFDPATGEFVPGGITEQTRQVLTNVKAILEAAGLTMDNVVKTTGIISRKSQLEQLQKAGLVDSVPEEIARLEDEKSSLEAELTQASSVEEGYGG